MHSADYVPSNVTAAPLAAGGGFSAVRVHYSPAQTLESRSALPHEPRKLSDLMAQQIARKEFFYGIELAARSYGPSATTLDYSEFGALLPLFTSLIWFGLDYWQVPRMADVESLQFAAQLRAHTVVLPHFTCYRTDDERLQQFLALNYTNVLALRGDNVHEGQQFQHAVDLVRAIRAAKGDAISIGVGGYPEGHPDSQSLEEDMQHLVEKVAAGADFIITQLCFSEVAVLQFIRDCRARGLRIPIVVGVYVPEDYRTLRRLSDITQVRLPAAHAEQYRALRKDPQQFRDYAVQRAVQLIEAVLSASEELGVYGVQFFTTNKFKCVQRVLARLQAQREGQNQVN